MIVAQNNRVPLGLFSPVGGENAPPLELLRRINLPLFVTEQGGKTLLLPGTTGADPRTPENLLPFIAMVAPAPLSALGDPNFCRDLHLLYPSIGGSMAKGISSVAMVRAFGEAGMLGFFGAAGLPLATVEAAIDELKSAGEFPFGCNLIHSPQEPELESALVELYLRKGIKLIEASAFLALTLPLVRYRTHGIYRQDDGRIITPNRIIAKISREEVAARFFAPPPEKFLHQLVEAGELTAQQAEWATQIPMAQDITAEADSGGHTDNRPALSLLPTILSQRTQFQAQYNYEQPLRVGLGGGIATPASAAAALSLGAAYLVTGSVNQACTEAGTCDEVRQLLAETRQADITMAPSGDMFEMGVNVQVLKRGTMFSMRAAKLYELYRAYPGLDALPAEERAKLEKTIFRAPLAEIWEATRAYFAHRDPRQVERAAVDPKHQLALVFRWYLGQSPVWASSGESSRRIDYQIWCGPAMGAFNEWSKGSFLEDVARRQVVPVALNILFGAAVLLRAHQLALQGVYLPATDQLSAPLEIAKIKEYLH
ncbi:MAG: PfaD family polyunsaturated fatty acid/polyketide biosynthesis protein [Desulfuromonadales bacterium]|nr:PfaD family polyunsaturated fatty acid/polyketide biosynthesis protein [Desulfuromonadales bacterium]